MSADKAPGRTYRCQVSVERRTQHLYVVRSIPPLHMAHVSAQVYAGRVSGWRVVMPTSVPPRSDRFLGFDHALALAGDWVGYAAGEDMRSRYVGVQRTAMGQQRCPYLTARSLCLRAPAPGTVWCDLHPGGRRREVRR